MMVDDPIKWLDDFAEAPIHSMTIHVESPAFASTDSEEHQRLLLKALRQIKTKGVQPAIAIKPKTDIAPYLELFLQPANVHLLHMILVMTVEPGFGGQAFMSDCLSKVIAACFCSVATRLTRCVGACCTKGVPADQHTSGWRVEYHHGQRRGCCGCQCDCGWFRHL